MFTAQVDLPTPPFPAPTERIFLTPGTCCFCGRPPVRETCASHLICALGEPGRVASAASMSSWILFLSGHAGVVSTTRMPIVAASTTATSWIILSSIIGRWSSGSCTADRALRTVSFESCVTAIRTSLPRAADVAEDDLVDQALHRRQVVGEHDAVGANLPDAAGLQRLGRDRLELRVRFGAGAGGELIDGRGAGGRVDHAVREAPVGVKDKDIRKHGVERPAADVDDLRVDLDAVDRHWSVDRRELPRDGAAGKTDERDPAGSAARAEVGGQQGIVPVAMGI